jgi:hypothetical protein
MGLTAHSSIAKAQVKVLTLVALKIYLVDLAQVLVADNNVRNVNNAAIGVKISMPVFKSI